MNGQDDMTFDPRIADWLEGDPNEAPEQALQIVLAAFPSIRQRRGSRLPWRTPSMNPLARMAVAAITVAIAVGGAAYLFGPSRPSDGAVPTAAPTPHVVRQPRDRTCDEGLDGHLHLEAVRIFRGCAGDVGP